MLVDVRSPGEFAVGHIPGGQRGNEPQTPGIGRTAGALNLPLFDDEARATVGTDFKRRGRFEARRDERERECKIPLYNLDSESNLDMRSILNPL